MKCHKMLGLALISLSLFVQVGYATQFTSLDQVASNTRSIVVDFEEVNTQTNGEDVQMNDEEKTEEVEEGEPADKPKEKSRISPWLIYGAGVILLGTGLIIYSEEG